MTPRLHSSGFESRKRLQTLFAILALLNVAVWCWALAAFRDHAALLAIALLVYGLGLRHAVDADHLAAIDNVTRKFVRMDVPAEATGFFFAMGHSAIVILVAAAVAAAVTTLDRLEQFHRVGGLLSTGISATFLSIIAAMNLMIFGSIYRTWRCVRRGGTYREEDLDDLLNSRGLLSRLLGPFMKLVSRDWHMFALGFLFGLGFDTATEIAMFGISAAEASKGLSLLSVLVFPALFAAGMSLADTADGALMLGAYRWASIKPLHKLTYNMTITLLSAVIALLIGGIEALALIGDRIGLDGSLRDVVAVLTDNLNNLGFAIIGVFVLAWVLSYLIYRVKNLDQLEARTAK
jgi:high-affinity nickel-transport protein